jgi:hypothetical protein
MADETKANTADTLLSSFQATSPKRGSIDQDEAHRLLKPAAPLWIKDGLGIIGQQQPKDNTPPAGVQSGVQKPLSLTIQSDPVGKSVTPDMSGGGSVLAQDAVGLPFQVITRNFPTQQKRVNWKAGIYSESYLFLSLKPDDDLSIDRSRGGRGLLGSTTPNDTDPGWFTPFSGSTEDKVWLELGISPSGEVTQATIYIDSDGTFDTSADAWGDNAYVEANGSTPPAQTKARKLIATLTQNQDDGTIDVFQHTTTNLVVQSMCINGQPALYPVPY